MAKRKTAKRDTTPTKPHIYRHFNAWSFSRLSDYDQKRGGCPRYAAWKHLARLPTEGGPAMARGEQIHKAAEKIVLGKLRKVPAELVSVRPVLAQLQKLKRRVHTEALWGFDRDWRPCAWDDWSRCWLRVKMDVHYLVLRAPVLEMIDWKSGRPKPDEHKEQLKLYGVTGLRRFESIERAHGVLHYTDHKGVAEELTVPRRDEKKLMKYWEAQVKPLFNDRRYAPAPGPRCRYCDYSKAKGGACEY